MNKKYKFIDPWLKGLESDWYGKVVEATLPQEKPCGGEASMIIGDDGKIDLFCESGKPCPTAIKKGGCRGNLKEIPPGYIWRCVNRFLGHLIEEV